jgi:antitoxin (DNA-binding transcriptional repressor) of toxin-antitoxin stability system
MKASILDLRYRMKDVLRAIDRGEEVTVFYRGKEKARLVPIGGGKNTVRTQDLPFFGMWKDRDDMADPVAYVRKLREGRYDHLFEPPIRPKKEKKSAILSRKSSRKSDAVRQ